MIARIRPEQWGFGQRAGLLGGGLGILLALLVVWPSNPGLPDGATGEPVIERSLGLEVRAQGVLRARGQMAVHADVSGVVVEVSGRVDSGEDQVRAGEWVIRLDETDLELGRDEAEAAWLAARADAAAVRGRAARAQKEWERAERLFRERLIPRDELDQADAYRKELESALDVAEAQEAQARIRRDRAAENLQRSRVVSPIDGILLGLFVQPGDPVMPGSGQPLFEVAPGLGMLDLRLDVNEADIGRVRTGQATRFTVEGHPGIEFVGSVRSVRAGGRRQGGVTVYEVAVDVENPDGLLLPGMSAQARIAAGESGPVPAIPLQALLYRPSSDTMRSAAGELERLRAEGRAVIWVFGPGGDVWPEGVRLGVQDASYVALTEPWPHGDDTLVLYRD